jgi:hypothetical protein
MSSGFESRRGIALIVTLLAIALFSALGLGLALSSSTTRMADHNNEDAVALLNAADSALELAAQELGTVADWNRVLDGSQRSAAVDGAPTGSRTTPGGSTIDLAMLTNELTCNRDSACSDAQVRTSTADRPWGANNPWWRLFVHLPLTALTGPRQPSAAYVIVWIGDDAREADGNPSADGGGAGAEGRYVVRARAEAFGSDRARRAIEAEFARVCRHVDTTEICLPGARVHSWRVAAAVP